MTFDKSWQTWCTNGSRAHHLNLGLWYLQSGDFCARPDEQLVNPASQAPPRCWSSVKRWSARTLAMSCLCLSMLWGTVWKRWISLLNCPNTYLFTLFRPRNINTDTVSRKDRKHVDVRWPLCCQAMALSPLPAVLLQAVRVRSHSVLSDSPDSEGKRKKNIRSGINNYEMNI